MTDLEMTKLCAEAMGIRLTGAVVDTEPPSLYANRKDGNGIFVFDPLRNDAQAMALLHFIRPANMSYNIFASGWSIRTLPDNETSYRFETFNVDLNRAIVECVAKMQSAKK